MQTYYVTATWDDFPEGGTCGEPITEGHIRSLMTQEDKE